MGTANITYLVLQTHYTAYELCVCVIYMGKSESKGKILNYMIKKKLKQKRRCWHMAPRMHMGWQVASHMQHSIIQANSRAGSNKVTQQLHLWGAMRCCALSVGRGNRLQKSFAGCWCIVRAEVWWGGFVKK